MMTPFLIVILLAYLREWLLRWLLPLFVLVVRRRYRERFVRRGLVFVFPYVAGRMTVIDYSTGIFFLEAHFGGLAGVER